MDLPSEAAAFSLGNAQKTSKAIQAGSTTQKTCKIFGQKVKHCCKFGLPCPKQAV